jgi:hypothetical protein
MGVIGGHVGRESANHRTAHTYYVTMKLGATTLVAVGSESGTNNGNNKAEISRKNREKHEEIYVLKWTLLTS